MLYINADEFFDHTTFKKAKATPKDGQCVSLLPCTGTGATDKNSID
jgi:hypothetical protein